MSSTYGDLKNACSRELFNRSDLGTEIAAAVQSAVAHYQKQQFWFTEEKDTATTVSGQSNYGLPTDHGWIDGITVIYSTNNFPVPIERRDWLTMQQLYIDSPSLLGPPTDYAIFQDNLWLWPRPNGAYQMTMWQNMQNAAPVNDGDSNNWTVEAEELIRSRAVADVKVHILRDPIALQEYAALGNPVMAPYFSKREMLAHKNMVAFNALRMSSGKIKAIEF